jgi:putative membrane protein
MDIRFWTRRADRVAVSNMNQSSYSPSKRWILFPVLAAAGLALTALAAWLYTFGATPPSGTSAPWSGWWFPFGWFFFIPIFFLIFFAFRWFFWGGWWWSRGSQYRWGHDAAFEILRERFASGEITKEQYEQMRKDLVEPQGATG